MTDTFLQLKNISKSFVGVKALDSVDFSIKKGEIHCLVGENGSGKSTLIKVISGVEHPDEGEIYIEGTLIREIQSIDSILSGIEVIYQDMSLFPNLTVAENISIGEMVEGKKEIISWKELRDIAKTAISKIKLDIDIKEVLSNLSIAQQQLIAICRALTSEVKLLIMDEPTSALTKKEIDQLFSVVKDLQKNGIAILFVSHKLNEIFEIAERITVLRDGKNVGTYQKEELTDEKLTFLMTGKKVEYSKFIPEKVEKRILLEVRNISKKDNFKDISFQLYQGEILGITGLLGSGRTELALSLFGMYPIDSGQIFVDGKPRKIRSVQGAKELGIGYVPENRLLQGLILEQSVDDNLVMSIIKRLIGKLRLIEVEERQSIVERWIQDLNIKVSDASYTVQTLSGGNQQRVVIAKWLAINPKILILDGPTIGIDVAAKSSIHNIIRELSKKGVGIIIISDEVPEIVANCNRAFIMRKGRFVYEFNTEDVNVKEIQERIEVNY